LSGGTRVILKPERAVTPEEMTVILDNIKQRLNVFGLSDIVVREIRDLNRQSYITVEIAGANQEQVRDLISRQGQFEARIANATVFSGGEDVKNVCLKPECSGIDFARRPCRIYYQCGCRPYRPPQYLYHHPHGFYRNRCRNIRQRPRR